MRVILLSFLATILGRQSDIFPTVANHKGFWPRYLLRYRNEPVVLPGARGATAKPMQWQFNHRIEQLLHQFSLHQFY